MVFERCRAMLLQSAWHSQSKTRLVLELITRMENIEHFKCITKKNPTKKLRHVRTSPIPLNRTPHFFTDRMDQSTDTDAEGDHLKLSTYVRLHLGRILTKMNNFDAYLNATVDIHSYLDNFYIKPDAFIKTIANSLHFNIFQLNCTLNLV